MPPRRSWRAHVPALAFLGALIALVLAVARPAADIPLATKERTIILAIDTSLSMSATDVAPTRLGAAQAAAKKFIRRLPRDVRVGIVAFAGTAEIAQVPTLNRDYLLHAIDDLKLEHHTAVGTAILGSIVCLFPEAGLEGGYDVFGMAQMRDGGRALDMGPMLDARSQKIEPVPAGSNTAAAIILLTDGISTIGMDARSAARVAADRGVRVHTVGFGRPGAKIVAADGKALDAGFDEAVLRAVADLTAGQYFAADNAARLDKVYSELSGRLVRETRQSEVSWLFTAMAAVLIAVGAALSFVWFPRFA